MTRTQAQADVQDSINILNEHLIDLEFTATEHINIDALEFAALQVLLVAKAVKSNKLDD